MAVRATGVAGMKGVLHAPLGLEVIVSVTRDHLEMNVPALGINVNDRDHAPMVAVDLTKETMNIINEKSASEIVNRG
jgi:hypothetical protein